MQFYLLSFTVEGSLYNVALFYAVVQNHIGQLIFEVLLYSTFEWACTKLYIVSFLGNVGFGFIAYFHLDALLLDSFEEALQLYIDNLVYGFFIELVKHHNVVYTI